jgi:2-polyprenyl-6-hydroxyphenyl methylase/3-demethylubiquinone-9 3-methyltransferase
MVQAPSVDAAEVARFAALADEWWDTDGKFAPLHRLNPVRLAFIRDGLCQRFGRDALQPRPLAGLRILDLGCGGGLVCEPLARLGAAVTGLDAGEETVAAAAAHAEEMGLAIEYQAGSAEALAAEGAEFDAVLALEVVEHVADLAVFLAACATLVSPGGVLITATLNRTAKSYLFAIVGAEYVLGWLPRGTHHWRRFVRPSELAAALRGTGLRITNLRGITYHLARGEWQQSSDVAVNYMALAQ